MSDMRSHIYCEDIDDSDNFTDTADVTDRTTTTNNTAWTADSMGEGAETSPDFTSAVQEVINRSGWSTGNNLGVLLKGNNDSSNESVLIEAYEGGASDAAHLDVTYSSVTISITNSPSTYGFGIVEASSTTSTGLTHFTLTNNGNVAEDITINGTDMTGGGTTWTLSDTATAGSGICGLKCGLSGGSYNIIVKKTAPYNTLKSDLAVSGTQDWGLQLLAPTANLYGNQVSGTVTLTATQH